MYKYFTKLIFTMRLTDPKPALKQLFIKKTIVAKFNLLSVKDLRRIHVVVNDRETFPTTTSIPTLH